MTRLPLLSGSSLHALDLPDTGIVLAAPPPLDPIDDVGAAVRDALRYPLAGPALPDVADPRARATIVVEPPVLPLPGADDDPRQDALAGVIEELTHIGIPSEKQTILVAGGLGRRAGRRELDLLLTPSRARAFHGKVVVHDAEDDTLRPLVHQSGEARIDRRLVDADLVVVVTAAETAVHGGPSALLRACDPETARALAMGETLLEPNRSPGWQLASSVCDAVGSRTPMLGVSLVLDHVRPTGRLDGWPHEPDTRERLARSHARRIHNALPAGLRRRVVQSLGRELTAVGVLAGPPAAAHIEALLRGIALRSASLPEPVETIVVPIPWKSASRPRDAVHPLAAAWIGLGLALRLWRGAHPIVPGAAVVLAHGFRSAFSRPSTHAARRLYEALRTGQPDAVAAAEKQAAADPVAIAAYRDGRAPHPLLPFTEWSGCAPALDRAGRVIVGGCRDATAARALGLVPSHNVETALAMAHGLAGGGRTAILAAPPYPPLVVGGS